MRRKEFALSTVERARDRITHPVGFLAESIDGAGLSQLLLAVDFSFLRSFPSNVLFFLHRLGGGTAFARTRAE